MKPPVSPSRTKYKTGTSLGEKLIHELTETHPFVKQIDVIFPSNDALAAVLKSTIEATPYYRCSSALVPFVGAISQQKLCGQILALSSSPSFDNSWCIDSRGNMTFSLSKNLYELLGLSGHKLPFKHGMEDRYHVSISLVSASSGSASKRDTALKAWDRYIDQEGLPLQWEILYSSEIAGIQGRQCTTTATISTFRDVVIPAFDLGQTKQTTPHELFEWLGMACMGSQRLKASDRPDPYVSLYAPPEPSSVGSLSLLRWSGFLAPAFCAKIIEGCVSSLDSNFIAFTAHGFTEAPVAFLPSNDKPAPLRYPLSESDGEDIWSLIISRGSWILAESIGKWDARWG